MKILNKIWGISLLAILLIVAAPKITKAQDEALSEQDFYDALSPYGTWVNDATYGNVWLPDVEEGFMPYQTNGYWAMTEYGNTWVSNYEWGWAPFHYGTWRFDDYYGWEWIPGYDWSPAWVVWRSGNGYYGWAPISPDADLSASIGGAGYDDYWTFAPAAYMYSPSLYGYYLPRERVRTVYRNSTVINNTFVYNGRSYTGGPHASDIARYTHQRPTVYRLADASRPGSITVGANVVNIFRPRISRTPSARPQQVVDGKTYEQQNPNQRIGNRQSLTFNRVNAQKLAQTARSSRPANNTVGVNGGAGTNQPVARPSQPAQVPATRPQPAATNPQTPVTTAPAPRGSANTQQGNTTPRGNGNVTPPQQNQANPVQQNNNPAQTVPYHGRPENRPNLTPTRPQNGQTVQPQSTGQQAQPQTQPVQQQQAVPQAQQQHRGQLRSQRPAQQQAQQQPVQQQQPAQQAQQQQAAQQRQQQQAAQQAQQQQNAQRQAQQQQRQQQNQAAQQQANEQAQQRQQQQAQQQAAQQAQQRQQQQAAQQAQQRQQQQAQQQAAQQAQQQQRQQQAQQQAAQRQAQQQAQQQQRQQQVQQQQQQRRPPPPEKKPQ
ncbi:DUF6600 domain-containing protein [Mucilaginibacter sp. dw_454]|uniref:DUF6600 domain-containing protein n=1 Tax=Mucilaginibacter sp. dw_454 TaxID=2720079 RepID=UPI001BD43C9D|nr:DUF6600 domain-containing protein [Mucilaginibacter sp. dw_454]